MNDKHSLESIPKVYFPNFSQDMPFQGDEGLAPHHNMQAYVAGMRRSMSEKMKLFEHLPEDVNIFFDIGCCTGELLAEKRKQDIASGITDRYYVGLDIADDMISYAKKTNGEGILFTTSFDEAKNAISTLQDTGKGKSVLVLSSVLHEVVHYQSKEEQAKFWDVVWKSGVDYVAIRDFAISRDLSEKESPKDIIEKIRDAYKEHVFPKGHPLGGRKVIDVWENGYAPFKDTSNQELASGFKGWGAIDNMKSMMHFLMSFNRFFEDEPNVSMDRYFEGIREMKESYVSLPFEDFCECVPSLFTPIFMERGVTDARQRDVEEAFGISMRDLGASKFIAVLKRREDSDFDTVANGGCHTKKSFVKELEMNRAMRDLDLGRSMH